MSRINPVIFQIVNLIAVIITFSFNTLVNILPLNGVNTGQVSNSYPNLFTPANYVFGIWFVIFTLLIIFMLYQIKPNQRKEPYLQRINFLYLISALANIMWLILFHYSYGEPFLLILSIIPMIILFLSLLLIHIRLEISVRMVSVYQRLFVHIPVSVYLGWISVAIIANIASILNVIILNIPQNIQRIWTALVVIIAMIITLLMIITKKDLVFGLVYIWASIGIAIKQNSVPIIFNTSLISTIMVLLAIILSPFIKRRG